MTRCRWLRRITFEGTLERYGTREQRPDAYRRLERELDAIAERDFPGYFLIVEDSVRWPRDRQIRARCCAGRPAGSGDEAQASESIGELAPVPGPRTPRSCSVCGCRSGAGRRHAASCWCPWGAAETDTDVDRVQVPHATTPAVPAQQQLIIHLS